MKLAPRLNVITGDNGLGKSFLLDVAWWALTRSWARGLVIPESPKQSRIQYSYTKKTPGSYSYESRFDPATARWSVKAARPPIPGLILYAQVDGGFSVWDPARNYWRDEGIERPGAFLFTPEEVWQGNALCEGLIRDWGLWQREQGDAFAILKQVLEVLSPPAEPLVPGLCAAVINSKKGELLTLVDPFEVELHWFALNLSTFHVERGAKAPKRLWAKIDATLPVLNQRLCLKEREEYVRCHRLGPGNGGIDLAHLELRAAFIGAELRRQSQLVRGDV